jgi:hypothetical protein
MEGNKQNTENNTSTDISEMSKKMENLHSLLEQNIFNNPLREVQDQFRNELIQFKQIFNKNLQDLDTYLVKI